MTVQADGKIVIGGIFNAVNGVPRSHIARLNADATGTLDTGFHPEPNGFVYSMAAQADGRIVFGGPFLFVGEVVRNGIARVNADGTLDTGFNLNLGSGFQGVALQADGKIIIGGVFGGGTAMVPNNFARLENDAATQSLTVPNTSSVQWLRGGASPETQQVSFELSTNGGIAWSLLGAGTRIAGGWELTGVSLPASGHIRARARTTGGYQNDSSGLIGQVATFSSSADADNDGLLDTWELTYWPTTAGHSALDDGDHDGYPELLELALGLNPTLPNPGGLPPVTIEGGYLTMTITKHPGVTYEVQSGATLLPAPPESFSAASTTVLTNDATTLKVRDNFPVGTPTARYLRLKVTAAP